MACSSTRKQPENNYQDYSDDESFSMRRHARVCGVASVLIKWKSSHQSLNESTVRGFRNWYETNLKLTILFKKSPTKKLTKKRSGRPRLLGEKLEYFVQYFLKVTRYNGGFFNTSVAIATANSLRRRYSLLEKENVILNRSWAQSIFLRIGFVIMSAAPWHTSNVYS